MKTTRKATATTRSEALSSQEFREFTEVIQGVEVRSVESDANGEVLTPEALSFLRNIHREFHRSRDALLEARIERQARIDQGVFPTFLEQTRSIREKNWTVAKAPADLDDRRVEITGPAEPKMMINALNSGAKVFMADLEDALSPTWTNVIQGHECLKSAARRNLSFRSPEGKFYELAPKTATLVVRPRGWHLDEKHVLIDGEVVSASIFDFSLFFFHNSKELLRRGSGPYFYLPKMESHLEARLWNDIFNFAQDLMRIPRGTIRATVLIETILAAFEMDEILYELRDHASGLNAGRWDYIFSAIKKFRNHRQCVFPDRSQVTMAVPFMKAYTDLLVKTCHQREAHALGGMAAFIPSRKDTQVNELAMAKVREDKERESRNGFDGTWVAHPDLVPLAKSIFSDVLGEAPHQKHRKREEVVADAAKLLNFAETGGKATETGFRANVEVALRYIERWISGQGAVAIHNLMEDAATAEICRAQLWQWIRHEVKLDDGRAATRELYTKIRDEEFSKLQEEGAGRFAEAAEILDRLVLSAKFPEFLTLEAYSYLV
jgi:malate synthase